MTARDVDHVPAHLTEIENQWARRTAEHWAQMARVSADERRNVGWLDSTLVQRLYIHPAISGNPDVNWLEYFHRRHLPRTVPRGLTIGCGSGGLERHAAFMGLCEHYDACDVSAGALDVAREAAAKASLRNVTYSLRDLNNVVFEPARYDVASPPWPFITFRTWSTCSSLQDIVGNFSSESASDVTAASHIRDRASVPALEGSAERLCDGRGETRMRLSR
jgi:SAM-dependent methyltransferase